MATYGKHNINNNTNLLYAHPESYIIIPGMCNVRVSSDRP